MSGIETTFFRLQQGKIPPENMTELMRACANGQTARVKALCATLEPHEINLTNRLTGNALTWAAMGHPECVCLLLEAGAWPNLASNGLGSPLYQAMKGGYQLCVNYLLTAHANPDLKMPQQLEPHYEHGSFVCLKVTKDTFTSPRTLANSLDMSLSPENLPTLNIPTIAIDYAQLKQLITIWQQEKKNEILTNRIDNLNCVDSIRLVEDTLRNMKLGGFNLWKHPLTESRDEMLKKTTHRQQLIRSSALVASAA